MHVRLIGRGGHNWTALSLDPRGGNIGVQLTVPS